MNFEEDLQVVSISTGWRTIWGYHVNMRVKSKQHTYVFGFSGQFQHLACILHAVIVVSVAACCSVHKSA